MEFLIAGIIASIAGTAGLINSIVEDTKANKEASDYIDYLDEMKALNETAKENKKADIEADAAASIEQLNENFSASQEEANRQAEQVYLNADLQDQATNVSEINASADFNSAIDNLYLQQAADTVNWNASAMHSGQSTGNAYSQLAASGVRAGSSLSDAVLMESAVNNSQLQFSQDISRTSQSNSLASVLNNLSGVQNQIRTSRVEADISRSNADYLVNSYLEGGHNYNVYNMNLAEINRQKTSSLTSIDNQWDQYMEQYDYNIGKAKKQKEESQGWSAFWHGTSALLSAGGSGFSSGYSLGTNMKNEGYFDWQ